MNCCLHAAAALVLVLAFATAAAAAEVIAGPARVIDGDSAPRPARKGGRN